MWQTQQKDQGLHNSLETQANIYLIKMVFLGQD